MVVPLLEDFHSAGEMSFEVGFPVAGFTMETLRDANSTEQGERKRDPRAPRTFAATGQAVRNRLQSLCTFLLNLS